MTAGDISAEKNTIRKLMQILCVHTVQYQKISFKLK